MPAPRCSYDWALIRVVPRVERAEFVNAGAIVQCRELGFLGVRIALDEMRLAALWPDADLPTIRQHLDALELVARGGAAAGSLGTLGATERFHWLVAPRSAVVQTSPVHSGLCTSPEEALDSLVARLVLSPPPRPPRT